MIIEQLTDDELVRLRAFLDRTERHTAVAARVLQARVETLERQRDQLRSYIEKLEAHTAKAARAKTTGKNLA